MKKLCLFFALVFIASCGFGCLSTAFAAAPVGSNEFDKTNVLDDLNSMEGFSADDYFFSTSGNAVQILYFVEYCYAFKPTQRENYGLYLYIFNRGGLSFDTSSVLNKLEITTAYNETGAPETYNKLQLQHLSSVEAGTHKGKFLKFKVKDTANILTTASAYASAHGVRRYDVSSVELLATGKSNASDHLVGGTWRFSGYAAGYGPDGNQENTLSCEMSELETLQLELHSSYYRPEGTNIEGSGTQDQLNTVYFTVPNQVLAQYGKISAVHMEWYEYLTKEILVTGNTDVYRQLSKYIGQTVGVFEAGSGGINFGNYDESVLYGFAHNLLFGGDMGNWAGFSYNIAKDVLSGDRLEALYYIFSSGSTAAKDYSVSSAEFRAWIEEYSKSHGQDIHGKYSSDLFYEHLDEGRQRYNNVNVSVDENLSLANFTLNSQTWLEGVLGIKHYTSTPYDGISGIYQVTADDVKSKNKTTICNKLYIAEADYNDFIDVYNDAVKNNETVILVRHSITNFKSYEVSQTKITKHWLWGYLETNVLDKNAYVAQQIVELEKDVIDVTFRSDAGIETIMACVADPIDVFNGISPPANAGGGMPFPWLLTGILAVFFFSFLIFYKNIKTGNTGLKKFIVFLLLVASLFLLAGTIVFWFGWYDFGKLGAVFEWLIDFFGGIL